jgi:hypothetical protein
MRYFFAIIKADGSNIDDKTSVDYPTESDAVVFGRSMAHDLAAKGDQYIGGSVLIFDEKGRQVGRAVAIRKRDRPASRLHYFLLIFILVAVLFAALSEVFQNGFHWLWNALRRWGE